MRKFFSCDNEKSIMKEVACVVEDNGINRDIEPWGGRGNKNN